MALVPKQTSAYNISNSSTFTKSLSRYGEGLVGWAGRMPLLQQAGKDLSQPVPWTLALPSRAELPLSLDSMFLHMTIIYAFSLVSLCVPNNLGGGVGEPRLLMRKPRLRRAAWPLATQGWAPGVEGLPTNVHGAHREHAAHSQQPRQLALTHAHDHA